MIKPTYTAQQIKEMATTIIDYDGMKVLSQLIDEEIKLYPIQDLPIIMQASMILFTRSLLMKFLK